MNKVNDEPCAVPDPIVIVDYSPSWPVEFERLRDRAAAVVGELAVVIEHVGSTAVPGLAAKPVMREDQALATEYEALKRELAVTFRDDRMGYTDAKTDFVTAASRP